MFPLLCKLGLFWDVTKRLLVVVDVSGEPVGGVFKVQAAWTFERVAMAVPKRR
jgi:hypothetical protein